MEKSTFAAAIGYTGNTYPYDVVLPNGHTLTLADEDGGYLENMGWGASNPWIGFAYNHRTQRAAQMLIAQRFCGGQPAKGEVAAMADKIFRATQIAA